MVATLLLPQLPATRLDVINLTLTPEAEDFLPGSGSFGNPFTGSTWLVLENTPGQLGCDCTSFQSALFGYVRPDDIFDTTIGNGLDAITWDSFGTTFFVEGNWVSTASVPEPSTIMGAGLALLFTAGRRRTLARS